MDKKEKHIAERKELERLTNRGMAFEVSRTLSVKRKGWKGAILGLREKVSETTTYTIEEPVLSTLDRLACEQLELEINEGVFNSDTAVAEARKLAKKHAERMARIVAIAVLGSDYMVQVKTKSGVKYVPDDKSLQDLTLVFFHNIKPTKLARLVTLITTMSGLGDFCNSIRSMSASRTTMPDRIEEKEED